MRRRRQRVAAVAVAAGLTLGAAACADDEGGGSSAAPEATADEGPVFADELQGLVRDDPLEVGQIVLPAAATGEPLAVAAADAPPRAMVAEEGSLLVAYFGYLSCPDVCPTSMSDLEKALDVLGDDAERVEVSFTTVDPTRDTPELMADYLSYFFGRWTALRTEDPAQLQAAEDAFLATSSVRTAEDGTVEVEHSAQMYVVDEQGEVVVEWPFGTSSDVMASDLRLLLDDETASDAEQAADGTQVSG